MMQYENWLACLIITSLNIPIKANSGFYDKGEYK